MWKTSSLLFALSFAVEPLSDLALERCLTLEGATPHVQGIAVDGATLYVSAVDREAAKGWLFEYDLSSGKRLRAVEIQQGARYHPGGFDIDDESLWIPVAEYRRESTTIIQRRSRQTLELISSFEVKDHIGCLAWTGSRLIGGNWDARKIYEWSPDGRELSVRANPRPTRYQELKHRYGALIGSGLTGRGRGAIEWLDPETLSPLRIIVTGTTDKNVPYTQEGFDHRDGRIYLLPEDSPSRLFIFRAS
ncbi:MAG: hypothetical protein HXY18_07000 [Bryobacteraceae bacterium]|nr:hypothetical protein [Bryobacteraceae bacterium]